MENKSGYKIMIINQDTFLLDWNEKPSEILLSKLLFLRKTLERKPEVLVCRTGYRSLLIQLNKKIKNLEYWNQYFNKILSKIEKQSKQYVKGVACPKCYKTTSDKQKERYKSRQKQVELAKKRNTNHIGPKEEVLN